MALACQNEDVGGRGRVSLDGMCCAGEADRLFGLMAPRNVNTTEIGADYWWATFNSPKLSFKSGWEAFCVDQGENCLGAPLSDVINGTYAPKKLLNSVNVTGLEPNSSYTCYVATTLKKGKICSGGEDITTKEALNVFE